MPEPPSRNAALFEFDRALRRKGNPMLCGVDEAGRGPWAGPVAAAAVVLPPEIDWPELNDSKKLTPEVREELLERICRECLCFSVMLVPSDVIDEINILKATFLAMAQAVQGLSIKPDLILVDGNLRIPQLAQAWQRPVVGGDGKSAAVAAASIVAKVTRDRWMADAHEEFPHYGFASNKGYGTPEHDAALKSHGPCRIHRRSFAPVFESFAPELAF